jgi:hypothetical protein
LRIGSAVFYLLAGTYNYMRMSQQTHTAGGGPNLKAIVAGLLVVAIVAAAGAGAAEWAGWISLPDVSLPF